MTHPKHTGIRIAHFEMGEIALMAFEGGYTAICLADVNRLFGVSVDPRLAKGIRKARCTRLGRSGEFWVLGVSDILDAAVRVRLPESRQRALDVAMWSASVGISDRLWDDDSETVTVERVATQETKDVYP